MSDFFDYLEEVQRCRQSLLCVGLDPRRARMPVDDLAGFTCAVIDATADVASAFKPNIAFFEAEGIQGMHALEETVAVAKARKVPVVPGCEAGGRGCSPRVCEGCIRGMGSRCRYRECMGGWREY